MTRSMTHLLTKQERRLTPLILVGPRNILSPDPVDPRSLFWRRLLRPPVQAKSVARIGGIGFRSWKSLGGSRR